MKENSKLTIERLKQNIATNSGCSPLYLRVLKSDLSKLLSQYMTLSDIDFSINALDEEYVMTISVRINDFYDVGKSE